jgi:serine protease Do
MQKIHQTPLTKELTTISDHLRRCTVQVRSGKSGAGSGVIWNENGVIITNAHVVNGTEVEVELSDKTVLNANVIARNAQRDLVALQIQANNWSVANVGDSDRLRVGEFVLAVGNPLGLVGAVTTGIIHTLGSTQHQPWIQADVRLAPGNSGGALANAQGQVIGINTIIVNGCGFAIPSNVVQRFLNDQSDRPYLGVSLQPVMVPVDRRPAYGLLITEVESDSPAEAANLQTGDVLIGVRGASFQTPNELFEILEHSHTDDGLPLTVLRGGQRRVAEVILYSREPEGVAA